MIRYEITTLVKIDGFNAFLFQGKAIYESGYTCNYLGIYYNNNPQALKLRWDIDTFSIHGLMYDIDLLDEIPNERLIAESLMKYRLRTLDCSFAEDYNGFAKALTDMGL